MEGLELSAFLINYKGADKIITGASSHNASAEKTIPLSNRVWWSKSLLLLNGLLLELDLL